LARKYAILMIILFAAIQLCSCNKAVSYYTLITSEDVKLFDSNGTEYTLKEDDLNIKSFNTIASDNKADLLFNPRTTDIAIRTKTNGTIWFSNPQDRLNSTDAFINAQLIVTTLDGKDIQKKWSSFEDSVKYLQFHVDVIENGIKVTYLFGKKAEIKIQPVVLTGNRFNIIINSIKNDSDKRYIARMYNKVERDKMASPQARKSFDETFTNFPMLNTIYVLKSAPSKLEIKKIVSILEDIGYTAETREVDEDAVGLVRESSEKDRFIVAVSYALENGNLIASIDPTSIKSSNGLKISEISILRNFGAMKAGGSGSLLIPDGSGAVIDANQIVSTNWPEYNKMVYGQDFGILINDKMAYDKQIYFPVFGAYNNNGGFLGIAEQGSGNMNIVAGVAKTKSDYAYVFSDFTLLPFSLVSIESSTEAKLNIYPKKACLDLLKVRYIFNEKENTQYDDLGVLYREYLIANKQLDGSNMNNKPTIIANVIGAIDDIKSKFGYPVKTTIPLTTFKQARNLAEQLSSSEIDFLINYSGWQKGGMRTGYIKTPQVEKVLGGTKDFKALSEINNVKIIPSVEQQFCYINKMMDGFSPMKNSIRFITRDAGYRPSYNIANYYLDENKFSPYIIKADYVLQNAKIYMEEYKKINNDGISINNLASEIYSDFNVNNLMSRNECINIIEQAIELYSKNTNSLCGRGANSYANKYLDYAYAIPVTSSKHPLITKNVPFSQIVLSGSITYTMPELNYQNNIDEYLLKAIETGSGIMFDYFAADGSLLLGTDFDYYYAASHASIFETVNKMSKDQSIAQRDTAGKKIISHKEIAPDVFITRFENHFTVGVNYSDDDFNDIPSHGYKLNPKEAIK
jgi:hypothetical protein